MNHHRAWDVRVFTGEEEQHLLLVMFGLATASARTSCAVTKIRYVQGCRE